VISKTITSVSVTLFRTTASTAWFKQLSDSPLFRVTAFQTLGLFLLCSCDGAFITSQDGAHTAFAYGSHYFRRQSSNSETRWRNLLMRSPPICILCAAFVREMLGLHRGNTAPVSRSEAIQQACFCNDNLSLRDTGALIPPSQGYGRCNVQSEVSDHRLGLFGLHMEQASLGVRFGIHSCIPFLYNFTYNWHKCYDKGTLIFVSSSVDGFYTNCIWTYLFAAYCGLMNPPRVE
jgi:hypothetical protein